MKLNAIKKVWMNTWMLEVIVLTLIAIIAVLTATIYELFK